MKLTAFSEKQMRVMTWWCRGSPDRGRDAILCDGAVRSGKTFCMALSFVLWGFSEFQDGDFGLCGKTILSLRRNLVRPLRGVLEGMGFGCGESVSGHYLDVSCGGRKNRYYLFGGKDESSAALIQGMTLCGVLFDEAALMPRSFVEQAMARCSAEGAKFWFNCNPEHPLHWLHTQWIQKAEERNALHLHFTMEDNPALSEAVKRRYRGLYTGAFYDRFILGKWVCGEGLVYPMFDPEKHTFRQGPKECGRYIISCDYGTVNPCSFGLWGLCGGVWHRLREYYYDSRREGVPRTDEEHYAQLEKLAGELPVEVVVSDPSAASFLECIRRHGRFAVQKAKNDVADGIRRVGDAIQSGKIRIGDGCVDTLREFSLYRFREGGGAELPVKENDHAMDDIRYFVATVLGLEEEEEFFALSLSRG